MAVALVARARAGPRRRRGVAVSELFSWPIILILVAFGSSGLWAR